MRWALLLLLVQWVQAQEYFPKNDGVLVKKDLYQVFTEATVHQNSAEIIENATIVVKDGQIISVGKNSTYPKNAVVTSLKGMHVYPAFIDVHSSFGIKKPTGQSRGRSTQYDPSREGFYWNDHIRPEQSGIESFTYDAATAEKLRAAGFGLVNTHLADGLARGTGALIALSERSSNATRVISPKSAQYFSLTRSQQSQQSYPSSTMGSTALMRQFFSDAQWYAQGGSKTKDRSLEAYNENSRLPHIFEAGDLDAVVSADKIGDQFAKKMAIVGGHNAYEDIERVKKTGANPTAYDVSDPLMASFITLSDMKTWNQAPSNLAALDRAKVPFAITTHGLKNPGDLMKNVRMAMDYGLSESQALAALTTVPAQILGQSNKIGQIKPGFMANFTVTNGPIFHEKTTIHELWIMGEPHVIHPKDLADIRGDYTLQFKETNYKLVFGGSLEKPSVQATKDSVKLTAKAERDGAWMKLQMYDQDQGGWMRFSGNALLVKDRIALSTDVDNTPIALLRTAPFDAAEKKVNPKEIRAIVPVTYPNVGYGYTQKPTAETVLFKNATVWTSEAAGILTETDVLVKNGKIVQIGKNISAQGKVIDATGKHLTAGIIDEHSHIALKSVNEGGQNSTAEVRMSDVVDSKHMGIYRDLAGGVTTAQLLHGSANPIGGQSAIIKMKWGAPAEELIYSNSPKYIKFALGENVKQSNWDSGGNRFPQSRMGVEQVFVNYFQRAKEYDDIKKAGKPYRYDEEMEVLGEILRGERFISCHSYVQSEINMMMKVAERFGFKVQTFTHILEGYKVADKMAEHGVGGSTFGDWWAYKMEVKDAIPYNAAIMQRAGVTVAINSDDAEMSRRLNQEAAKTVKYGGMSEEEAWKMVTINPAKLLHLDQRVGSIKVGKDADLVLWSAHPMAVYAMAEKTMIEGAVYFDRELDQQLRKQVAEQREMLIQQMLDEKNQGRPTQLKSSIKPEEFHCDTM
ncbi:MAG: hypothetical protein RLZZ463_1358 [Bacteroidota bacterium]